MSSTALDKTIQVGELLTMRVGLPNDDGGHVGPFRVLHALSLREMADAYRIAWQLDSTLRCGGDVEDKPDGIRFLDWLLMVKIVESVDHTHLNLTDEANELGLEL